MSIQLSELLVLSIFAILLYYIFIYNHRVRDRTINPVFAKGIIKKKLSNRDKIY